MSGELAVSFVLKLNDQASGAAQRALQTFTRELQKTAREAQSGSQAAVSAWQKMASAREQLGIRSEREIQREIQRTEAAYQRLASSGTASARELARAQEAMRRKVAELRQEMGQTQRSAAGMARGLAQGAAGFQAAKFVLADPIRQTMSYDRQLAHLANTAFAGESLTRRRAGMGELDAAIMAAVRAGGGTREGALATLDKLVASGAFADVREATAVLPALTKFGTAANADPSQLADIAIRARRTFGLTDFQFALDQAMKAGQLGGFELKDMAKWLPQQMAAARMAGLRGDSGFRTLLAANQAVAITAGTKDEAGNNLVNLLTKITSRDTANDAKNLGIDLAGSLAAARAKGVNSLDAFVNLTEQIVARDKRFAELRTKARSATGDERRATFEAMGDILQGSAIGQLVQDRQALMALLGIMNNRAYMQRVGGALADARGTGDAAFALIEQTPSFKAEQLAAEKAEAMQKALDKVNPLLGGMAEGIAGLAREFPGTTAAVVSLTTAATAAAAALAAVAGAGLLLGGGKGGLLKGAGAAAASAAGWRGRGAAAVGSYLTAGAGALGGLAVGAAGLGGYAIGTGINKLFIEGTDLGDRIGGTIAMILAKYFDNEEAKRALEINLSIDGQQVATTVNSVNARDAKRR